VTAPNQRQPPLGFQYENEFATIDENGWPTDGSAIIASAMPYYHDNPISRRAGALVRARFAEINAEPPRSRRFGQELASRGETDFPAPLGGTLKITNRPFNDEKAETEAKTRRKRREYYVANPAKFFQQKNEDFEEGEFKEIQNAVLGAITEEAQKRAEQKKREKVFGKS
jgi:hypothetical protein